MPQSYNNLYSKVYDFQNLLIAFYRARAGKRKRKDVAQFEFNLEKYLIKLSQELKYRTYRPGKCNNFYIKDQKRRLITAAPFRDRIVHHALLQVIEPIFERMFIFDSYGCRVNKGQHRACDRYQQFARNSRYVLKCDIQKFYPSVDHKILLGIVNRWIKDKDIMGLIKIILESGKDVLKKEYIPTWFPGDNLFTPFERAKGLPIGNLTSQFFGNIYLNELDHFIKENLRIRCYLRYMDDFALFDDSKKILWTYKKKIIDFLSKLRFILNPKKQSVIPVNIGVDFLGYRIYPSHRLARKSTVYRYIRRLKCLISEVNEGKIPKDQLNASLKDWYGHIKHAHSYNFKQMVIRRMKIIEC